MPLRDALWVLFLMCVAGVLLPFCIMLSDPSVDLLCTRPRAGAAGSCSLSRTRLFFKEPPLTFAPEGARFESLGGKGERVRTRLRITTTSGEAVWAPSRRERALKAAIDDFVAHPGALSSARHLGDRGVLLVMFPFMVFCGLLSNWFHGGELFVRVEPGRVVVRRKRWLLPERSVALPLPFGATPVFSAVRVGSRSRSSALRGDAGGGVRTLANVANHAAYVAVAADLNAHFAALRRPSSAPFQAPGRPSPW